MAPRVLVAVERFAVVAVLDSNDSKKLAVGPRSTEQRTHGRCGECGRSRNREENTASEALERLLQAAAEDGRPGRPDH